MATGPYLSIITLNVNGLNAPTKRQTLAQFSSAAQCLWLFATPWLQHTRPPVHHQLLEFTQTHVHQVGDTIQPSHPLSSPFPPAPNLSQHQSFPSESTLPMRWPKYWSFSFSITPSKEHPGLISFRIDWLDLLAVQGTLKNLLQQDTQKHQFFGAQLLHSPTLTSIHDHWKNHSLD